MAGWFEAAQGALDLFVAFLGAFPRFSDLGMIEDVPVGTIVVTPTPITVLVGTPVGTTIATISVTGGSPSYTYSLSYDQLGYFTIVGNQLQVNSSTMSPGIDNIIITATGSLGDTLQLPTTVVVQPSGYVPTY